MKDLIERLKALPADSIEFYDGFNILLNHMDELEASEKNDFLILAEKLVKKDDEKDMVKAHE